MQTSVHQFATPQRRVSVRGSHRRPVSHPRATRYPRRSFLHLTASAALLPTTSRVTWAQVYPARPVRLVVGFPAGGQQDIIARLVGQWLAERLGQTFVIENRPGTNGNIGAEAVVRAPADGYTLLLIGAPNAINATFYEKELTFSFTRDIAPIAGIMRAPNVLEMHPSVPVTTVPEFVAYAKSNPGKLYFASGGNGNPSHVAGEMFKMMAGINMIHVPYRGVAPALTDLLGGHVQVMFDGIISSIDHIRAGKLRPLAVTTATRSEVLPGIPSISEFLPGYEASGWNGIGAPKNTSAEIIEKLNRTINAALDDPKMKGRISDLGGSILVGSPADLSKFIADDVDRWGKAIKFSGAKPE